MEGTSGYILCYNYNNSGQNERIGYVSETQKISNNSGIIIVICEGLRTSEMIFYIENNEIISVNGRKPEGFENTLRGRWIFQVNDTTFRLNLTGAKATLDNSTPHYGSLVINGFIPIEVYETVFLNNLYNIKIAGGQILINTNFQVIDISFYSSSNPLNIFAGSNFKPINANRVLDSEFLDDSKIN